MTRRRWVLVALCGAAIALVIARLVSTLYVDYAWYATLHATAIWRARVTNVALLSAGIGLTAGAFVFANLYAVRRSIAAVILPRRVGNVEVGHAVPGRHLTIVTAVASLVIGGLLALPAEPWTELALARFGVAFGESEPYFQSDLGFFVYWLPLETALYVRAMVTLLVTICLVVMLYFALTPSLRWERNRLTISPHVRRHAAVLAACVFGALAWSYRLDAYDLLSHGTGPAGAFAYTDHHLGILANQSLAILTVAAGLVTAVALWRVQIRTALVLVSITILLPLVVFRIAAPLVARGGDAATLARRATPYMIIRDVATRRAYGVDRLALAAGRVGASSIAAAAPAVGIWDPAALIAALEGDGSGRIVPGAVGWQWSPVGLLALAVSRGDDPDSTSASIDAVRSALIRVRGTVADDRGAPRRVDSLGRPASEDTGLPPILIYDGATEPAIVADSTDRIAAPSVDGFLPRVADALSEQHLRLLDAQLPGPHPKLLVRRGVRERVNALVPFFAQGETVTPAVAGDSLYWIIDLYSASDTYPLSAHFMLTHTEESYFQHAGRAFVHATTGRVLLIADDDLDPIALTWVRRFPQLFARARALPPGLAAQLPPTTDGAIAIAAAYAEAGARGDLPRTTEDRHHAVIADGADSALAAGAPPCVAMAEPGDIGSGACAWNIPLVDASGRLTGLVIARGGTVPQVAWRALTPAGPHWSTIVERLAHAMESDSELRRDGPVVHGRIRTFLVGGRLAFAQPVYTWRTDGPPVLARVLVATEDSTWTASSLLDSAVLPPPPRDSAAAAGQPFRDRVTTLYDAMQDALRRGDLTAFGAAYGALGRLLGRTGHIAPVLPAIGPLHPRHASDSTIR